MADEYKGCSCGQYSFDPYDDLSIHHNPGRQDFQQALKVMKVPKLTGKSPEERKTILRKAREEWIKKNYHPSCHHSKEYRRNASITNKVYAILMTKYDKDILAKRRLAALAVIPPEDNLVEKEIEVIELDSDKNTASKPVTKESEEELDID